MGSRRIKEHEETNITNVGTKSIVSEKEKKIRKKKPITKKVVNKKNTDNNSNNVVKKNNNIKNTKGSGKDSIKIIPLGGLEEIGKNITVFEYNNEAIIVDCGLAFPEDDMLGVDIVIPDFTYIEKNIDRIKGLVITHGHEDHIGSIPYLLKKVNVPIYSTAFTIGLINSKLKEHNLDAKAEL